jgi:cobalt-zinc-cadmium resistance protein CzcA
MMGVEWDVSPAGDSMTVLEPDFYLPESSSVFSATNRIFDGKLKAATGRILLNKNSFLPSLTFALRRQYLISGFNPYDIRRERFVDGNFMGFELGVNFPLFFGADRSRLRAAKVEREVVELGRKDALRSL